MKWQGKFIGGVIGFILGGGLPGLVIGVVLGHFFDTGAVHDWLVSATLYSQPSPRTSIQKIFFETTFSVLGYLAKCDGRVSESEIKAAEQVMQHMSLNYNMRQEAIRLFKEGKRFDFNWQKCIHRLRDSAYNHPNLLRTFIEFQLQMVCAGGVITLAKRRALQRICAELGVSETTYIQFEQRSHAEQHYQNQKHYDRRSRTWLDPEEQLQDAYQILGLNSSASDDEVKRTYRRLLSKHHPDKLVAQGLPPEMMKLANEKTQKIKSAYQTIKKARAKNIN